MSHHRNYLLYSFLPTLVIQQARELDALRGQRDKQKDEIKAMAQEKGMTIQNDFEKKVCFSDLNSHENNNNNNNSNNKTTKTKNNNI